jgi:ribose-phosphate pyrophosphokinase
MLIVSLPGGAQLAAALSRELGCDTTELALHRFPDGEVLVRLDTPVQGRCVVFAGSLHHPDEKTLPLVFAADAARELGASQVGLVAPYLAYMRQDKRFHPGEAVTSRSYAKLLSSSLDFLLTADPHLHRWHNLQDIYPIRVQAVSAAPAIARWVQAHVESPLLVGPDSESEQWVAEVGRLAQLPWTVLEKTRHGDREVRVKIAHPAQWSGRTPVLLDDIVSTGHTMIAAAQSLQGVGLLAPVCVAVHSLFVEDAFQQLLSAGVRRVATCDTVPHPSNAIPLAPALADALRKLAHV